MSKVHRLKCWPELYVAVRNGFKTFEVRTNVDRDFEVGDTLELEEYDPDERKYTGNMYPVTVTYIMPLSKYGGNKDMVIMGIKKLYLRDEDLDKVEASIDVKAV